MWGRITRSGKMPNHRKIAPQALERFKTKIRVFDESKSGKSIEQVVEDLSSYLRGWGGYFGFCPPGSDGIGLMDQAASTLVDVVSMESVSAQES
jgi:hypothetical protein